MTPQRARTYLWLFVAMSASVCANLLLFQQRSDGSVATNASPTDARILRAATPAGGVRGPELVVDTVRAIQRELKDLNLYPGQVDGKATPLMHAAIVAYEQAQALPITGEPTQSLLRDLIVGPSAGGPAATGQAMGVAPGSAAERLIRDVRQRLIALGYTAGHGDGRMTLELIRGIRAFERDNAMPQTGRISAPLLLQLQRSAAAFKPRAESGTR
jgi:peptidoglycan hydrolase-like protein with peptidoglycan-binding domain